jgi:hypothetical protein
MQSVPITTVVVSLNLDQDGVYNNVQCDKVCQRLATGQLFFSPDPHFSSTNNTERGNKHHKTKPNLNISFFSSLCNL